MLYNIIMRLLLAPNITIHYSFALSKTYVHILQSEEETEHNVGRFVWPTAVLMLEHMISSGICHYDAPLIIELGAGCGVLGMGLAHALSVTSSQNVPID